MFEQLDMPARGKKCIGMQNLIKEGQEMMSETDDEDTLDALMIAAAQKIEHYEIASYGTLRVWANVLGESDAAVQRRADSAPIDPVLALEAARAAAGAPDRALVADLAVAAGLEVRDGRVGLPGRAAVLASGPEAALSRIEERLRRSPFTAPEQHELDAAGLGPRELAAAEGNGRILRLPGDVVLLPNAPALAMRQLAALPQPFTTSDARKALDSTRRIVIPLLEHLDRRGWTRRLDGSHREVAR